MSGCKQRHSSAKQASFSVVIDSANKLYDSGKQARAVFYLDSAIIDLSSLSANQRADFLTIHYNYYLHIKGDNNKALRYADELLKLSQITTDQENKLALYGKARFFRGDVLFRQNKYNEAYLNYFQGKLAANKSSKLHNCMLSDYSYHMGMILYKQERYRLAAQSFRTSFNETMTCDLTFRSFYRRQELLNNVGISFNKIDEPDSALFYFDKALIFLNNVPKKYAVANKLLQAARGVIYGNQASVYINTNHLNKAKALLKKSISINSQEGFDNNDALLSQLKLVKLYEKQNQIDSMFLVLKLVQTNLLAAHNDEAVTDWNSLMASYYEHKGQYANSVKYYKQFNASQAAVFKKTFTLKATDVTEELKRFEGAYEVNELKRTNELKSIYLIVALVVFVMAITILMLLYANWKKSKRLLSTMSELNLQINAKNEDLQKALAGLELSNQEKDRILRTVVHDLRNPIGGIASLTTSVIEDDNCSAEQRGYLRLVKDTAYNSLELINEILEATNNSNGALEKQWVDINDLLYNSVELLKFKAAEKNQQILLEALDESEEILISREKIWRVVSNLIVNAIKFSPVGSKIKVKVIKIEDDIEILVNDHGIGIPVDMKNVVFHMFTEAKRPGTLGEKSFGLGLSICRQIVELHNGEIWFDSNAQDGTTFYVKLKQVARTATPVAAQS
ncbi:HAMP domain-containing sensor histidine kinase [Mucilaginibacter sp. PAMB04274]|uniref:tetratricopeptide repeat-containing sensor histidine kinase n=1 Tax=Mucilaginibacter sp. PAMB04274 TaxID=3138568 RepID=UPI00332F62F8